MSPSSQTKMSTAAAMVSLASAADLRCGRARWGCAGFQMLGVRLLIGAPLGRLSARGNDQGSFDDIVDCCYAWNTLIN
jgi:hypothetical protein